MKNYWKITFATLFALSVLSCQKDDPVQETDQEEIGTATLTFTEVTREEHGDHYHYEDLADPEVETVEFKPTNGQFLPPVGAHLDLEEGKTYRLQLKSTDFAGREVQQTFLERAELHQVFLLGAPSGTLEYVYADRNAADESVNVGVTGYLTVLEAADPFVFEYILRHLNPGVKSNITAADWNNSDYTRFGGANDLHLRVQMHLVDEHGHDH